MVTIKQITAAVNERCKVAMALAGYQDPRCSSLNTEKPKRPGCMTHISSQNTVGASGGYIRTVNVAIVFFPENPELPYDELKNMDDCLTRAFLNPIFVDGYRALPNSDGIRLALSLDNDVLGAEISYDFDVAEDEIRLDGESDEEMMELLLESMNEGE